ncbi:MAG: hypothetical protein IPL95_09760 [Saprospiraceae bacterium]|nr:hypothetical protein [Saprospiraceae bacterium]
MNYQNIPNSSNQPNHPNLPIFSNQPNHPNYPNLPNLTNHPNYPNLPNLSNQLPCMSTIQQINNFNKSTTLTPETSGSTTL